MLPFVFDNIVPHQNVGVTDRETLFFKHRERFNGVFAPRQPQIRSLSFQIFRHSHGIRCAIFGTATTLDFVRREDKFEAGEGGNKALLFRLVASAEYADLGDVLLSCIISHNLPQGHNRNLRLGLHFRKEALTLQPRHQHGGDTFFGQSRYRVHHRNFLIGQCRTGIGSVHGRDAVVHHHFHLQPLVRGSGKKSRLHGHGPLGSETGNNTVGLEHKCLTFGSRENSVVLSLAPARRNYDEKFSPRRSPHS